MYVFLLQDPIRQTMVAPDQVQYYFQLAQHHAVTMQQQVKILIIRCDYINIGFQLQTCKQNIHSWYSLKTHQIHSNTLRFSPQYVFNSHSVYKPAKKNQVQARWANTTMTHLWKLLLIYLA